MLLSIDDVFDGNRKHSLEPLCIILNSHLALSLIRQTVVGSPTKGLKSCIYLKIK